jgi:hypothetical protein
MAVQEFRTGRTYRCRIHRCGYTIDIYYTGYVPTLRPAEIVEARNGDHA